MLGAVLDPWICAHDGVVLSLAMAGLRSGAYLWRGTYSLGGMLPKGSSVEEVIETRLVLAIGGRSGYPRTVLPWLVDVA